MGYKRSEKRIKELESLVWVKIKMVSYGQFENLEAKEALEYDTEYLEKNKTDIRAYFLIKDIEENPAVIVETTLPREIYKEGINTLNIFLN
jgi:sensor domain CHASE-containing protein